MHLFYTPDLISDCYILNKEESQHCIKVLRLQLGDKIFLTDGIGNLYQCKITIADPKHCEVQVQEVFKEYEKRNYKLHIAIAPTKNMARLEWFLEKATEIGIDEITPIICEHSVRAELRLDRLEKIISSAVKQSLKAYHPVLHEPVKLKDFLKQNFSSKKLIAYCDGAERISIKNAFQKGDDVLVVIGPEGDFSAKEVELALEQKFTPITMGQSRLRTETAALTACQSVYFINEL